MNDNIEGMSKYTTTVISPTMKDVDDTLVVVKSEVKRIGDRTDMLHLLNFGSAISELEKKVTHLEGFSMRVENVHSAANDAFKNELSRSNVVTEEVVKYVKTMIATGGELHKSIEHLTSLGSAASDVRINNGMNEIANVKQRVIAIETGMMSNVNSGGTTGGKGKMLLEYHVIHNLHVMSSNKSEI